MRLRWVSGHAGGFVRKTLLQRLLHSRRDRLHLRTRPIYLRGMHDIDGKQRGEAGVCDGARAGRGQRHKWLCVQAV
ncbi:pectinesterase [Musa troglodytarum]|nr:pectinesterase [Musa troglodytarum]